MWTKFLALICGVRNVGILCFTNVLFQSSYTRQTPDLPRVSLQYKIIDNTYFLLINCVRPASFPNNLGVPKQESAGFHLYAIFDGNSTSRDPYPANTTIRMTTFRWSEEHPGVQSLDHHIRMNFWWRLEIPLTTFWSYRDALRKSSGYDDQVTGHQDALLIIEKWSFWWLCLLGMDLWMWSSHQK